MKKNGTSNFFPAINSKFNSCHAANTGQFCSGGGGIWGNSFSTPAGLIRVGDKVEFQLFSGLVGRRRGTVLGLPNKDGQVMIHQTSGGEGGTRILSSNRIINKL